MILIDFLDRRMTYEHLGYLTEILMSDDPRPVADQLNDRYAHGGGYHPGTRWSLNLGTLSLQYPGDPPLKPLARFRFPLSKEVAYLYDCQWLVIVQEDNSFAVTRVD